MAAILADCERFQRENAEHIQLENLVYDSYEDSQAGHDFWLTRNDHGAGF